MSKRPYPWEEGDYQRQFKTHVNDRMSGDESHMQEIYSARRAANMDLPGTSTQSSDPSGDDMEMDDDYESYEQPSIQGNAGGSGSGGQVGENPLPDLLSTPSPLSSVQENTGGSGSGSQVGENPLPDLLSTPGPSSSSSGLRFEEAAMESSPELPYEDVNGNSFWPRISPWRSRLDVLRNMERRDPSPVPSTKNLLTSFIHSTQRTFGPLGPEERETLYYQARNYRQLNLDPYVKSELNIIRESTNHTAHVKDLKDVNDNSDIKEMDL